MEKIIETKPKPQFVIETTQEADVDEANEMRMDSWLETYPNKNAGVSREWVESQHQRQLSEEAREERRERFLRDSESGKMAAWVAKDEQGKVIGSTTPYTDDEGKQHVGSLYVLQDWHGTGAGSALMQKVIDWCDGTKPIELEVAAYNMRARAFYEKWGFNVVPESERLHREIMPVVKMIKEGVQDEV